MSRISTHIYGKVIALLIAVFSMLAVTSPVAHASYDGGHLIDNSVFLNSASMSIAGIQQLLASKGSGLASRAFVLNCYGESSKERQIYTSMGAPCDQTIPAADIIYYASQAYGINPQVVIATLQKEQSLITSPNPTDWQISQAMGYGCPTSGSCSSASNFSYQVDNGTWLLRFHFERARGNMTWWYTSSSWACDGSNQTFYRPSLYPGQNVNFYDEDGVMYRTHFIENAATSSFYCYTPHTYNNPQGLYGRPPYGNVGRYYSGSYNFVYFFELWFGITSGPVAFKTASSPTIYLQVSNYKMAVPYGAVMQDYGVSYEAVQTVSQAYADTLSTPSNGLSASISHVIKSPSDSDADGGSIYLISLGKRYQFQTLQQLFDFGFTESDIAYLPYDYIIAKPSGGMLPSFVTSPLGSVFEMSGPQKRVIFEYDTYKSHNPSDRVAALSYYLLDKIPSGNPVVDRPVLLKKATGETVYLYENGNYHQVATYDTFVCWGFDGANRLPLYRFATDSYVAPFSPQSTLSCLVSRTDGAKRVLAGAQQIPADSLQATSLALNAATQSIIDRLPTRATPLKPYIKSSNSAAVWYSLGANRRLIPTYSTFQLLNLDSSSIDIIDPSLISALPYSGYLLAPGQLVKTSDSAAVYTIGNNARHGYQSSDIFLAFKNSWSSVDTIDKTALDQNYPVAAPVSPLFIDTGSSKVYLAGNNNCFLLSQVVIDAFGTSQQTLAENQAYGISSFRSFKLQDCKDSTRFVRPSNSSLVYWLDTGKKVPLYTYSSMLEKNNNTEPVVMVMDPVFLSSIPSQ